MTIVGLTQRQLLQQAEEKEALAVSFDTYSERLDTVFAGIPASPGASKGFWTGPAADRYTSQAHQLGRGVDELKEACTATARNLRRRAEQLRKEAAQVPDAS